MLLLAVLEAIPDAVVVVNPNGHIVWVNGETGRMFGYSQQELTGQPVELLVPERFRQTHATHVARYLSAAYRRPMGLGLELHGRRKDGREFPVEISLAPLETEEGKLVIGTVRDVTEYRRLQDGYRRLFNHLPVILGIAGTDGYFRQLNPFLGKALGFSTAELLSQPFLSWVHPEDRAATVLQMQKLASGIPIHYFENRYLCKDGSYRDGSSGLPFRLPKKASSTLPPRTSPSSERLRQKNKSSSRKFSSSKSLKP